MYWSSKDGSGAPTNFGAAEKEVSKSLFAVNLTHARKDVNAKYWMIIMLNKSILGTAMLSSAS